MDRILSFMIVVALILFGCEKIVEVPVATPVPDGKPNIEDLTWGWYGILLARYPVTDDSAQAISHHFAENYSDKDIPTQSILPHLWLAGISGTQRDTIGVFVGAWCSTPPLKLQYAWDKYKYFYGPKRDTLRNGTGYYAVVIVDVTAKRYGRYEFKYWYGEIDTSGTYRGHFP